MTARSCISSYTHIPPVTNKYWEGYPGTPMVLIHMNTYIIWCIHSWWGVDSSQFLYYQIIGQVYFIILFLGFIYPSNDYNPIKPSILNLTSFPGRPPGYYKRQQRRHHICHYYLRLCVIHNPIHNPIRDLMCQIINP